MLSSRTSRIELIDADPGVRAGLVDELLGTLPAIDGPRLARGVGVTLLATSVTAALGLAEVDDLNDETESGEVTDGRDAACVGLDAGADVAVFVAGAVVAGFAPGASEVLRVGAVEVVEGRVVVDGGGIDVRLLPGAAVEAALRIAVVAVGGLELAAVIVAVAFVAAAVGAARVVPAPNVPELRTYRQTIMG